ncbi:Conserved_hypothetical protein [Hexamita inflata]|uniref:Uncharacterized protein n=1 Tax=Hexamita inflata TaxID=28002 RepID=A0AA86QQQ0_9EUKA|nr:Conserved hypothetical protein [Hexamita inflata]
MHSVPLQPSSQVYGDSDSSHLLQNTYTHKYTQQRSFLLYITGHLSPLQLLLHSISLPLIWCIYGLSYFTYNTSNHYSVLSCTFSFLGSWDSNRNPTGWYWFTIGMVLSSLFEVPLVLYVHLRLVNVNKTLAQVGTGFWLVGIVSQFLVGCFSCSNSLLAGDVSFGDVHNNVASVTFVALLVGAPVYAALVGYDKPESCRKIGKGNILNHFYTDLFMIIVVFAICTVVFFCVLWQIVYLVLKSKNPDMGSSFNESMNTVFSFALWENVVIITLYIILWGFPFTLPTRIDGLAPKQRLSIAFKKIQLDQIHLKTDIAKIWYLILNQNDVGIRNAADFLENLADCEEMEGLVSQNAIQTLTKIAKMINNHEKADEIQAILKEFTKSSYELWNWQHTIKKCIK